MEWQPTETAPKDGRALRRLNALETRNAPPGVNRTGRESE
jgi:hypothetical protein